MPTASPALLALAEAFRTSTAGRKGSGRDFTIDYEAFLRRAHMHDGDCREIAERDLSFAAESSSGALKIERSPRSGIPQVLRLASGAGEKWLFDAICQSSPTESREQLARLFLSAADLPVPAADRSSWCSWLSSLADSARSGASVAPFGRDEPMETTGFALSILSKILNWREESLVRQVSTALCGDSKALESMRPRLESALQAIRNSPETTLADFGIHRVPPSVAVHGPLILRPGADVIDLTPLRGPIKICLEDLKAATIETSARFLLTVENETVFHDLARQQTGWLLIHTSYPGSAVRELIHKLPTSIECHHFGDTDPAGFDILRDLRERCHRAFRPFSMIPRGTGPSLDIRDRRILQRLLQSDSMTDLQGVLTGILESGVKGDFEQEGIPTDQVLTALRTVEEQHLTSGRELPQK